MLIYDLETDGLRGQGLSRVHSLRIIDRVSGRRYSFNGGVYADGTPAPRDGPIEEGVRMLEQAKVRGGHNVINYDEPVLRDFYDFKPRPDAKVRDSMVECRVIWTNIWDIDKAAVAKRKRPDWFQKEGLMGAHKLKAWGARLGVFKGEFNGAWEHFTQEMDSYGFQDPEVNLALFDKIDSKNYSTECLDLENEVARIIQLQEDHGFFFNRQAAETLLIEMQIRQAELEDQLRHTFRPWYEPKRKNGGHEVIVPKRDNRAQGYVAGCPATKVQLTVFNPGSRDHIANRMKAMFGWAPTEFTDTGKPKVDEETLDSIDAPEARLVVEYLTLSKRIGQIGTGDAAWLKKVGPDGRIHFRVNTNGAVTGRMTHTWGQAQCPKVKLSPAKQILMGYAGGWGWECRSLFTVPDDCALVGTDAEGLELRMLGHYMARFDGGAYGRAVVDGKSSDGTDVHTINQQVVGLNTRDNAKTFIYAYLYGAGNFKLGMTVLGDMTDAARAAFFARHPQGEKRDKAVANLGGRARKRVEEGLPALGKLQDLIKDKARRGFLKSLDGRLLHVRSQHSALNTLLQGGGAVVMKRALVLAFRRFTEMGWVHGREYAFVANVHDEFQKEVLKALAEIAGQVAADAIAAAGAYYGMLCPLAGKASIGTTWADSH